MGTQANVLAQLGSDGISTGFKNRIINGAMVIDQRNAGASVTPASGSYVYSLDRWTTYASQSSKMSVQQNAGSVTPPTGFSNYLGITSLSAYTVGASEEFVLTHFVEGTNVADLGWGTANAKTITISFWVRSSLTGTFGGALMNSAQNRAYPFSYTISSANTWEQKTLTVAGDTTGTWLTTTGRGIQLTFSLGVGSTYSGTAGAWTGSYKSSATGATSVVGTNGATFYITGVQLEVGNTATDFEYRPYGTELQLCQRYYHKSPSQGSAPANQGQDIGHTATAINANELLAGMLRFPVVMRTTPTLTMYRPNAGVTGADNKWSVNLSGGWAATTDSTYNSLSDNAVQFYFTQSGSFTFGQSYLILGAYAFSAEL